MTRWTSIVLCVGACRTTTTPPDTTPPPTESELRLTVEGVGPNGVQLKVDGDVADTPTVTCALDEAPALWRQLVPFGGTWAWLGGADLPTLEWIEPEFDDAGWSRAVGPLGYNEDTTIRTSIEPQDSNLWLRTTFDVADPAGVEELVAWWRRDDGVVLWLNGTEIHRDNAPDGPIDAQSLAPERASGNTEESWPWTTPLPHDALRAGENVLAVALLDAVSHSDASFDLRLAARLVEPPDPDERHVVGTSDAATTHDVVVRGLLAEATYTCNATTGSASSEPQAIRTAPPIQPSPPIALWPGSAAGRGYTLFNHQRPCVKQFVNRLYIVDADGRVRWAHRMPIQGRSSIDIEAVMLDPEHVLFGGGDQPNSQPRIVDLDHQIVHEAAFEGAGDVDFHHDVATIGDEILALYASDVTSLGGRVTEGFGLVLYDPDTQQVSWRWDSQSAVDAGTLPDPDDVSDELDPYHANAFSPIVDSDGPAVYVHLMKQNWVIRIDRATDEVTWRFGVDGDFALVDARGEPLPDDTWFDHAHGMVAYDGDRVWLHNNGHNADQTEVMAFTLDPDTRTATLDWRWTELRWYETNWGDVDELPNGNAWITMAHNPCHGGHEDHMGAVVEVDPTTDDVVYRLDFLDMGDSTYRSQHVDGCAVFANQAMCPP